MHTVDAELLVTCIIDEAILELLQVAFFVKKQALEPLSAESRLVLLARRRTPPLLAPARRTCWAARSRTRRNVRVILSVSLVGLRSGVPVCRVRLVGCVIFVVSYLP